MLQRKLSENETMSRLRTFIRKSRGTVGLQVALAMLFPAKSKAGTAGNNQPEKSAEPANPEAKSEAPPHLTGRWDFGRLFEVAAHPEIVLTSSEEKTGL